MLFFSYFKELVGKEVTVELKNDLAIRGTLHSVDQYLNIKLENTRVVDQDKYPHMLSVRNCFIRGSVVRYVQLPPDVSSAPRSPYAASGIRTSAFVIEATGTSYLHCKKQAASDFPNHENMEPKYDISAEESRRIMEVIAATGKFWSSLKAKDKVAKLHDWDMLRSLLSSQLKQALEEYPESQMVGGAGSQQSSLSGETYPELARRLDEALLSFMDGPPFTLQRLCEILLSPKSTYKTLSKLALALEKNLLVTSTITMCTEPYPTELLQKSSESDKVISDPPAHHSSPTPNGVEALARDVDEEMIEAEANEDAMNSDMDMQEDKGSGTSESSSEPTAGSDPPVSGEEEHD
ncbi:hypothetical protein J5N97_015121 [Dioscorea zingiberensis]|uniref:Sm domain-containing protein n=1 Tax=Dioscorea zingiberensis TaxID=325984 RepID=A0A9D5CVY4_9LILI|nr:hypothetical protein J5N97_015121 [Dioscorea zingiberensis]